MSIVKRIVQALSFAIGLILIIVTAISLSQRNYGATIVATILASPFFWISRSLFRQGEFISKKKEIVTLVVDQDGVIQDSDYEMYLKIGVKKYQVLATLDLETCPYCQKMDLQVFPLNEYKVGSTAPPFHDGCRCCTVPYIDEEELAEIEDDEPYSWGTRAARDPKTGKTIQVPGNMTYKEWKENTQQLGRRRLNKGEKKYEEVITNSFGSGAYSMSVWLQARNHKGRERIYR